MQETRTTCCYCGVGCGLVVQHDGSQITGARGDAEHPASFGRLCAKGSTLHLTARPATRARYPDLRRNRGDMRSRVGWDEALGHAAQRFAEAIRKHGPDAVALYVSGLFLAEDDSIFSEFEKGLIGTNNIDSNSRLCMSSALSAYKLTLGADAPPCSYEDLALADRILIPGSNTGHAHPIVFRRIEDARAANSGLKIIAIDPRHTDTAALSLWCQGLNQTTHGTHNGAALIHLHLATGQIGKPGAGPFSLTGQPNAMGVREVGGMANLLSAHRDLLSAADRAEVARLRGVDSIPEKPGKTAAAPFEAVRRGEIRAPWITCSNPAQSLPDQAQVREALERCEFVVLLKA